MKKKKNKVGESKSAGARQHTSGAALNAAQGIGPGPQALAQALDARAVRGHGLAVRLAEGAAEGADLPHSLFTFTFYILRLLNIRVYVNQRKHVCN